MGKFSVCHKSLCYKFEECFNSTWKCKTEKEAKRFVEEQEECLKY